MSSYALAKARSLAMRSRSRAAHEIAKREHTMYSTLAATALGIAEAKGHKLPQIFGMDGTIVAGIAALMLADNSNSGTNRLLQSFGDGMLAIGGYKMGRSFGGAAISGVGGDVEAIEAVLA